MNDHVRVIDRKLTKEEVRDLEHKYRNEFVETLDRLYHISYDEHVLVKWWPSTCPVRELIDA